jgi:hypothetical protein
MLHWSAPLTGSVSILEPTELRPVHRLAYNSDVAAVRGVALKMGRRQGNPTGGSAGGRLQGVISSWRRPAQHSHIEKRSYSPTPLRRLAEPLPQVRQSELCFRQRLFSQSFVPV